MATTRVTLRPIKRKKQSFYQLDYAVNGKRIQSDPTRRTLSLFVQKSNLTLSSESMEYLPQVTNPFPLKT
jgi:hypothetical protein